MNAKIQAIVSFLEGKKTYIFGAIAIVYGFLYKDANAVFIGLTACGIRSGIATEFAKLLTATSPAPKK